MSDCPDCIIDDLSCALCVSCDCDCDELCAACETGICDCAEAANRDPAIVHHDLIPERLARLRAGSPPTASEMDATWRHIADEEGDR